MQTFEIKQRVRFINGHPEFNPEMNKHAGEVGEVVDRLLRGAEYCQYQVQFPSGKNEYGHGLWWIAVSYLEAA